MLQLFITGMLAVCALLVGAAEARAQSALDGFDPGANHQVRAIAVQADGKIIVGGQFTTLGGGGTGTTTRNRIARLNPDGSVDTTFDPGANNSIFAIAVQADGKILVGGIFTMLGGGGTGTTTRNRIARLNPDGSLDTTFNPGANAEVDTLAVQADGKILVGGQFTMLGGGGTGTTTRNRIARLNPDGSLDTAFNPGANSAVLTLAVQPDGKILVGGLFTTVLNGQARDHIARLNPDGSLDAAFNPGANSAVNALALQADGKILVGGFFTSLGGQTRLRIGRLHPDGTLDTAFNSVADNVVYTLAVQPDGKLLVGGVFTSLGGQTRNRIGRLNPNGSLDTAFNPGANSSVLAFALQADGKILVGGEFTTLGGGGMGTTTRNNIGRLHANGSPEVNFNPGANFPIYALAVQADGKVLVGGDFTTLGGGSFGINARSKIGRLNADGSIDTTFNPGANDTIQAIALQPDGKILVGGDFTMLGGGGTGTTARNHLGRLNPDGSLDMSFNPGANGTVRALAMQADGKILVGGNFTMLGDGGTGMNMRQHIGRLNPDGSLDIDFNPGANNYVNAIAVQADGKILVGGAFTMLGGGTGTTARSRLGRLNADGTLDVSFNPGANNFINVFAAQPDGKILVGGDFTMLGGGGTGTISRNRLGRLNPDGSLDTTFDPGADNSVVAIALQADGKILVGGFFFMLGGGGTGMNMRQHIGRLNPDGSIDTTYVSGANSLGWVFAITAQADGKILVGGAFTELRGATSSVGRNYIGRLTNTAVALQNLTVAPNGHSVQWQRSGSSPELERVTFELSTDGSTYTPLGQGTRIMGGWILTGLSLPTGQNIYVRARGFYHTGFFTGSYSVVESVRNAFINAANTGTPFDFDGDKLADVSLWNPNNQNWYIIESMTGNTRVQLGWGNGSLGDIAVPADYDGDGRTDIAVYRPSEGNFYVINSGTNAPSIRNWGGSGDIPVPADYDGDGRADYAVFRPSEGNWYIINSQSNTVTVRGWGASEDKPVPRDYDADGRADIAVFRPSEGTWYVINSATNTVTVRGWGASADKVVPADYDSDGHADFAVWRESEGNWYILRSTGGVTLRGWGTTGDVPVPADYDGDGLTDIAVFRPTEGTWYIIQSASNTVRTAFLGGSGDVPAPATVVR